MVFFLTSVLSSGLYVLLHHQARMRFMSPETYSGEVGLVILLAAVLFSALTAGAMCVWSILMTHRVCGPLHLLHGYISELRDGHLPKVRPLRKKDEFKDLMDAFSAAVETLRDQKQRELAVYRKVLETANVGVTDIGSRSAGLDSGVHPLVSLRDAAIEALGGETPGDTSEPPVPGRRQTPVGVG
jgi:hypothetical protein